MAYCFSEIRRNYMPEFVLSFSLNTRTEYIVLNIFPVPDKIPMHALPFTDIQY